MKNHRTTLLELESCGNIHKKKDKSADCSKSISNIRFADDTLLILDDLNGFTKYVVVCGGRC